MVRGKRRIFTEEVLEKRGKYSNRGTGGKMKQRKYSYREKGEGAEERKNVQRKGEKKEKSSSKEKG